MNRLSFAVVGLALLAVGCSGGNESAPASSELTAKESASLAGVTLAGKAERNEKIGIFWDGRSLHVADDTESAQKLFIEPKRGAFTIGSLPARFGQEFEAHGWERNDGEGFGYITYRDLVVGAIYHQENVDEERANALLEAQRIGTDVLSPVLLTQGKLRYSFWEDQKQRLMVLIDSSGKKLAITVAMGDKNVLDALGASPEAAQKLQRQLDPSSVKPVTPLLPGTAPSQTPTNGLDIR